MNIEKGNLFCLVAEVDGKVISNSGLQKKKRYSSHVREIGVGVTKGYRNIGIGTEMMKILISHAVSIGLKILTLCIFSSNKRVIHVYEKLGLKETGRIPNGLFKDRKYQNEIIMVKKFE